YVTKFRTSSTTGACSPGAVAPEAPIAGVAGGASSNEVEGPGTATEPLKPLSPEPRVERVAQPVGKEIHTDRKEEDGEGGEEDLPPGDDARGAGAAIQENAGQQRCARGRDGPPFGNEGEGKQNEADEDDRLAPDDSGVERPTHDDEGNRDEG